ncbi:hypothetical protein AAFC00_007199 [Neodothiora populina]
MATRRPLTTTTTSAILRSTSPIPTQWSPSASIHKPAQQLRCLHATMPPPRIPKPTPFVPDPSTFLTLIGRNMSQHSAKFPDWESLFSLSSAQLRESGIEPARSRRYLLHWRERFRNGEFGIGGDLDFVDENGRGELKIVEVPVERPGDAKAAAGTGKATLTSSPGMRKIVVNVPAVNGEDGVAAPAAQLPPPEKLKPVRGVKIIKASVIAGPHIETVKGKTGVAAIVAKEGLWEQKRGHKIDGGERRKAEVRSKRRAEERKTTRG